jgi:putative phage-type endonuclease
MAMSIDPNVRRMGIGGSEAAALFGCHPYLDEFSVWARKKDAVADQEPTERMIAGRFFEEAILKFYAHRTRRDVEYFNQTLQDKERPWMIYTPDGLVRGERRGVDAKLVAWDQRRNWGTMAGEVPEYIQVQAYYYMAAMDYPVWDIAAMVGDELRIIPVERLDAVAERQMLLRISEWHQRYILGDDRPEMGSSPAAARWLQTTFPRHKRPDLRYATEAEILMLTEYAQVRFEQAALKEHREKLENLIKAAIADKEGLVWPNGKFTWRRIKDSTVTDWESMARGLLNEYVKDKDKREELEQFYTRPKPGYRKIRFEHDDLRGEEADAA